METDKIVQALLDLGVGGPAVAVDVLRAAHVDLPPQQVARVMNTLVMYRANQARAEERDGT
jgi:hypothetical protein